MPLTNIIGDLEKALSKPKGMVYLPFNLRHFANDLDKFLTWIFSIENKPRVSRKEAEYLLSELKRLRAKLVKEGVE